MSIVRSPGRGVGIEPPPHARKQDRDEEQCRDERERGIEHSVTVRERPAQQLAHVDERVANKPSHHAEATLRSRTGAD